MTSNGLVFSLIELYIGKCRNWKMVELWSLEKSLCKVNFGRWAAQTLYLYGNPTDYIVYRIMNLYKNYLSYLCTFVQEQFKEL